MAHFTVGPWPHLFPCMDQPWFLMFTWTFVKNKFSVKGRVGGRHSSELAASLSSSIQQSHANESALQNITALPPKKAETHVFLLISCIPMWDCDSRAGAGAAELALCRYTHVAVSPDNLYGSALGLHPALNKASVEAAPPAAKLLYLCLGLCSSSMWAETPAAGEL